MRPNEREVAWVLACRGETSRLAPAGAWVLARTSSIETRRGIVDSAVRPRALRVVTGA